MENYIGSIYSALAEAGIDTSNMTFEEVLEKYNEIAEDVITIEEATEEIIEEVEEAQEMTEETEQQPQEDVEEQDKFVEVVAKNKDIIIQFLKEQGLL